MEYNVFFPSFEYIFFTISPPPNLHETTSKNFLNEEPHKRERKQ
jgi:hypothetical protein